MFEASRLPGRSDGISRRSCCADKVIKSERAYRPLLGRPGKALTARMNSGYSGGGGGSVEVP